jgi:hypothetical protein
MFWHQSGPQIRGTLSYGHRFSLELSDYCVPPRQLKTTPDGTSTFTLNPGLAAADYTPRTLLGVLDSGELITLIDAHMQANLPFLQPVQTFTGYKYLLGAHIPAADHRITGIRWTWDIKPDAAQWLQGTRAHVTGGSLQGHIVPWRNNDRAGLQFRPDVAIPLNDARQNVVAAATQLLVLWSGRLFDVVDLEVQLDNASWHPFATDTPENGPFKRSDLLPLDELALETLAQWLPLAKKLDPLPYIAGASAGVLQIDAHAVASGVEGLHRRMYAARRPLETLSKAAVKRAMRAGREAAVQQLLIEGLTDAKIRSPRWSSLRVDGSVRGYPACRSGSRVTL